MGRRPRTSAHPARRRPDSATSCAAADPGKRGAGQGSIGVRRAAPWKSHGHSMPESFRSVNARRLALVTNALSVSERGKRCLDRWSWAEACRCCAIVVAVASAAADWRRAPGRRNVAVRSSWAGLRAAAGAAGGTATGFSVPAWGQLPTGRHSPPTRTGPLRQRRWGVGLGWGAGPAVGRRRSAGPAALNAAVASAARHWHSPTSSLA